MSRTAVFIDTNICMHWQPFEQIPWQRLTSADFVRIVLCPPITRELDRHKEQNRLLKHRERAQATLARAWKLTSKSNPAPLGEHAEFFVVTRDARLDDVAKAEDLDLAVADDALVAHAMAYRGSGEWDCVVVAAGDFGVLFKAKHHGVETLELPEVYRLPSAVDDVEQEIRKLKQEYADLQQRAPKLVLTYTAGGTRFVDDLSPYTAPSPEEREDALAEQRDRFPLIDVAALSRPRESRGLAEAIAFATEVRDPKAAAKYNEDVHAYLAKWAKFHEHRELYKCAVAHTTTLSLQITNEGSSPAEDVDLDIDFRGPIAALCTDDDFLEEPTPPSAPQKPVFSLFDAMGRDATFGGFAAAELMRSSIDAGRFLDPRWSFADENSADRSRASIHVKRLKHTLAYTLPPLLIVWSRGAPPCEATLSYKFTIGNRAKPVSGELLVGAKVADEPTSPES